MYEERGKKKKCTPLASLLALLHWPDMKAWAFAAVQTFRHRELAFVIWGRQVLARCVAEFAISAESLEVERRAAL